MSGEAPPKPLDAQTLARNLESLKLSKKDIRMILAALKRRWAKNYIANAKLIAIVTAMQGGLLLAKDEDVATVWIAVLDALEKFVVINATTGDNNPVIANLRDAVIREIEEGEF